MPQSNPIQYLENYSLPKGWDPGATRPKRIIWIAIGKPILSSWVPGTAWRKLLLRSFGAKIGIGGRIKPRIQVTSPWRLRIGDYCWLGECIWIDNLAKVTLGNRVCISQGSYLCTGNHNFKSPNFNLIAKSIEIKDEVWIAANATIGPGSQIGSKSIISLGSVVTGKINPGEIMKGNPAISIGNRP